MKIALISREYPPDTAWGGIAFTYEKMANILVDHGHQVHVICQALTKPEDIIQNGVEVHRIGTKAKRYSALARLNYTFHAWLKLREIIRKRDIDIVCASYWGAEGLLCSLFERIPLIITTHTSAQEILKTKSYSGKKEYLNLKILSFLENFPLRRATRIIANSESIFSKITSAIPASAGKIDVIHHAVDTDLFKMAAPHSTIRQEFVNTDEDKIVLCTGRLELRKGTHILLKAIQQVASQKPFTVFILLGKDSQAAPDGGSFKKYLIDQAKQANFANNLVFIESVSADRLIQLYQACDVYVSASLQESFGLTLIEAMACGKPVIATPTGIAPELKAYNLAGVSIVPAGNAEKLAEALISFLSLPDSDVQKIAVQQRNLAEREFSCALWADKIAEVYEKTFKKENGSP